MGSTATSRPRRHLTRWRSQAIARDGVFVSHFGALAAELGLAIAVTYLEAWPGGPRNTVTLFDRRGREALTYAKVHTCAFDWPESALTPGDGFPVAALDTAAGPLQVGAMICFDREFPETARILALDGAELILVPNACPMEDNRTAQLRARAFENMVGVALANSPGRPRRLRRSLGGLSPAASPTPREPAATRWSTGGAEAGVVTGRLRPRRAARLAAHRGLERRVPPAVAVRPHRRGPRGGALRAAAMPAGPARRRAMSGRPRAAVRPSPATAPIAAGAPAGRRRLYVVAAWVPRRETIVVGSLGAVTFARGWYAYVGSARRGRDARVARHRAPASRCAGTPTTSSAGTRPPAPGSSTRAGPSASSPSARAASGCGGRGRSG